MKQHDVIISGLNMDLTDAIKNVVQAKVEKLFEHEDRIIRMRVELEYDSHKRSHQNEFIAKGTLEVRGNACQKVWLNSSEPCVSIKMCSARP